MHVTFDGNVYADSFQQTAVSADGTFHPTLLLVSIRLGVETITPVYHEALKATLQMPQAIGIAGFVSPSIFFPLLPTNIHPQRPPLIFPLLYWRPR